MDRIEIPLSNGYRIVAERNADPNFSKELFIGVVSPDGVWTQDLAVVRPSYKINHNLDTEWNEDQFDVLVYADKYNEDFTHDFTVNRWDEEKDNYE